MPLADPGITAIERGRGPAVVLVHGALGDHRQWDAIAERLETTFRVVSLSRRHHWPQPPPPPDAVYTYESHAADLVAWLPGAREPVHLAGHSYGAGVALLAASADPRLVRSLTLIEPAFASVLDASDPELQPEQASRSAAMADVQALVREGRADVASERLIDWVQGGAGGFGRLPAEVRRRLLENAATIGPTFASTARNVSCEQLRRLAVPALVLNGSSTRLWYRRIGEAVAACLPHAASAAVPAAAHMAIVENPVGTAELMRAFLGRH